MLYQFNKITPFSALTLRCHAEFNFLLYFQQLLPGIDSLRWHGGEMGRALDQRSTGRGFKSYSGQKLHNNLGQVVHIYVPLSQSSITWYRPRGSDALRLGW